PGALAAAWGRQEPVASEDVAHGAVRAAAAQLQELALDPAISPSRILPGKEHDQILAFGALARPAAPRPPSGKCPLPPDQLPVPAQQGLRADQEGSPGRAREDPSKGGQDQAIGRLEAGPTNLTFENTDLVTEGENLDPEGRVRLPAEDEGVEQRPDQGVEQT